ncbi:DUF5447 family protein [Pseudomonas solani]|uniref:DUF5447 family protein n=1 Tax=Pseudomonas solani TaxID=2731552 RepID=A0AAU7XYK9_9PSED
MKSLSQYLRQPHPEACSCSVCWSRRELANSVPSPSTVCPHCLPAEVLQVDGRWVCRPVSRCAKHTPPRRPPKYWHVVYDSGKPTPYVPIYEPFELE